MVGHILIGQPPTESALIEAAGLARGTDMTYAGELSLWIMNRRKVVRRA